MRILVLFLLSLFLACASTPEMAPEPTDPYVLVLGSAQDGGLPQLACTCERCSSAREDPEAVRFVVSILLVDPRSGSRWLFEATPDLGEQVELARDHEGPAEEVGRPALFDGIFLTHAHIGHYTGLMQLGREVYGSEMTPVYGTSRLMAFLTGNGPWDLLFRADHLEARTVEPGETVELAEDLCVTAIAVPHREEYSETVAYQIRGPNRSLLFLPDTDKWDRFERPIEELIEEADYALLDGTFFSGEEIPGREMSEIPHPFIAESLQRFAVLAEGERAKIAFTHLNHSNPVVDGESDAARVVREAGFGISRRWQVYGL